MTATPHDALFKAAFSQIPHAIEELRHVLPTALLATMDLSTLTVEPGSFVDEALRARYTDLLYSLTLAGRDARVYVLFEHQRSVILRYLLEVRGADEFVAITTTVREIDTTNQELMQTIAQMLESRGHQQGLQQGQSRMLLRLLHRRFGEVPTAVTQRVEAAEADELEQWAEQLFSADSLDDIFRG